jgi:CAAX prenyl protease-like protein
MRVLPGLIVGIVGIALWIGICQLEWDERIAALLPSWLQPAPRVGFNPFSAIGSAPAQWAFVAFRLIGLALLVPVVEELFWRGFLARWLIAPQWQSQPLGRFSPFSFVGVTLLFMLAHPEWLAAAVYCGLLNLLLAWTRDLWNCVVAHGVSNLLLGIYVLVTGSWQLW